METQATEAFDFHTSTQHKNFLSNLRKMFSYVGATAGNYRDLLAVMGATLEDQKSLAETGLITEPIDKYAYKIVAALRDGDEDVIREFVSAIGGSHANPDNCDFQRGFLVQWIFAGGSLFGIVTDHLRVLGLPSVTITLLNRGERLCTLVENSFAPQVTYLNCAGLATLMRASAVMAQAPYSFTVRLKDIIEQTRAEWNDDFTVSLNDVIDRTPDELNGD